MASSTWHSLPIIGFLVSEWQGWRAEQTRPCYSLAPMPRNASELPPYPIDMWPLMALPYGILDEAGVPYNALPREYPPPAYHPTTIAQYALTQWNAYLATGDEKHRQAFIIQAHWLVAHELRLADDAGGWPIPFASRLYNTQELWLSALTQGNIISVLVRAYRLTGEDVFLQVARRAIRTFELDIRDGGVSTSVGDNGVFFIFALFGLYDYIDLTGDAQIAAFIRHSLVTMHTLIDEFDTGYWSRYDLVHGHLAPQFYHDQHSTLLKVLARYSGCEHCVALAARWTGYQHSLKCLLRYFIASRIVRYRRGLRRLGIRGAFSQILKAEGQAVSKSICVPAAVPPAAHPGTIEREIKNEHV